MFADPSMFSSLDIQQTPCGNCSVRLQHFIAYVHGAANMTTLAGPAPYSNYALHACKLRAFNQAFSNARSADHVGLFAKPWIAGAGECIVSGPQGTQRVLVHDVTRAHDVCNASYRAFKRYSNIFGRTVCFGCRADRRVCVQTMRARRLRMRREAGGGAHA